MFASGCDSSHNRDQDATYVSMIYRQTMEKMVNYESKHDEKETKKKKVQELSISEWIVETNYLSCSFYWDEEDKVQLRDENAKVIKIKFGLRDAVKLFHHDSDWSMEGKICETPCLRKEEVAIEFFGMKIVEAPTTVYKNFSLQFVFNDVPYQRMLQAVSRFDYIDVANDSDDYKDSLAAQVKRRILGLKFTPLTLNDYDVTEVDPPANLPSLDEHQQQALETAMSSPLTLIQGPPGTGKTIISAHLVYHLYKATKSVVLVCTASNVAMDNLMDRLISIGNLNIIRVLAKEREYLDDSSPYSLHREIIREEPSLEKLYDKKVILAMSEYKSLMQLQMKVVDKILARTHVVCCTCSAAADKRLLRVTFQSLVIDECAQATEPEAMIPISKTNGRVVLVGDHLQLGPFVMSDDAKKEGMETSLFQRIIQLNKSTNQEKYKIPSIQLRIQKRMHPLIAQFPCNKFYEGLLINGVTAKDRDKVSKYPWPSPDFPLCFYSCTDGQEEEDGTSWKNVREANYVEYIIKLLMTKCGIKGCDIGVITPYDGQRTYLNQFMTLDDDIEVDSVDAFQGREKEVIIMSCVRSNTAGRIGFLKDHRRLNVAITRARCGFIVIGNPYTLIEDNLWRQFIHYFRDNNAENTINLDPPAPKQKKKPRKSGKTTWRTLMVLPTVTRVGL